VSQVSCPITSRTNLQAIWRSCGRCQSSEFPEMFRIAHFGTNPGHGIRCVGAINSTPPTSRSPDGGFRVHAIAKESLLVGPRGSTMEFVRATDAGTAMRSSSQCADSAAAVAQGERGVAGAARWRVATQGCPPVGPLNSGGLGSAFASVPGVTADGHRTIDRIEHSRGSVTTARETGNVRDSDTTRPPTRERWAPEKAGASGRRGLVAVAGIIPSPVLS